MASGLPTTLTESELDGILVARMLPGRRALDALRANLTASEGPAGVVLYLLGVFWSGRLVGRENPLAVDPPIAAGVIDADHVAQDDAPAI